MWAHPLLSGPGPLFDLLSCLESKLEILHPLPRQGRSPPSVGTILSGSCGSQGCDPGWVPLALPSHPGLPEAFLTLTHWPHTPAEIRLGVGRRGGNSCSCSCPFRSVMKSPSRNFLLASGKGRTSHKELNTLFRWLCLFWRINGR